MSNHSFSIIIPTLGNDTAFMLNRTLTSIASSDIPTTLQEIVVVENGYEGRAKYVCDSFKDSLPIVYLLSHNKGSSAARNLGAMNSSGDILIFFDDDIRISIDTLTSYNRAFQALGTTCFYGGPVAIDYEKEPDSYLVPFLPDSARGFSLGNEDLFIDKSEKLFLGANHAIPRKAFSITHGFDELGTTGRNVGFIGEETRIQEKLILNGLKGFYISNALIWHHVPQDSCNERWLIDRYYRRGQTEAATSNSHSKLFAGSPRWAWRKLAENTINRLALKLINSDRSKQLELLLETSRLRGLIDAYKSKSITEIK